MVWVITLLVFFFFVKPVSASVVINEFMAKPDDDTEWVELYNPTNQTIDLNSWQIKDGNTSSSDDISLSGQIDPYDFRTFDHNKGWLNDTGNESITLLNSSITIDSYQYSGAVQGKTYGRNPNGSNWTSNLTPTKNSSNSTSSPSPTPSSASDSTSTTTSSSFSISSVPSQIDSVESFKISVSINSTTDTNTKYYLKGAFRKSGETNYFGATKVSSGWIGNGKTFTNQFPITLDSNGNWSGTIEVMPDILDNGYDGSGEYLFKVGKYSESGSLSWSNEVNIKINAQELILEEDKESEVLGKETTDNEETQLPVEIYALEKYKRLASGSAVSTPSASPEAKIKSEKSINFLSIIGTLLIIGGVLATIITYAGNKFRN